MRTSKYPLGLSNAAADLGLGPDDEAPSAMPQYEKPQQGVEPDYEAAFKKCKAWFTRPDGTPYRKPSELYAAAYEIVEAAIGDRLLVDPTTEEEE